MSEEQTVEIGGCKWQIVTRVVLAMIVVGMLTMPVAADHKDCSAIADDKEEEKKKCQQQHLENQMTQVGDFLSIVIAAVAVPNGAFGVFQWMTAGTDTEQTDKGRKRIRNSFIGVAGAGAVLIAVRLLTTMV